MEFLFWAVLLGLIPASIAHSKGYSFGKWWLGGALMFIIALPWAIIMKRDEAAIAKRGGLKQCPQCAEYVKPDAQICRFCRAQLTPGQPAEGASGATKECLNCGKRNRADAYTCMACSRPL